ncbi:kinase-like protein [Sistotremastrum suecicum HHB10207 ss-3]|uniref:Kinase-like protein n=1 Tax=Sistotremastrum suecicum HHB10207 ss-3 TaxID=1314776 RepID=A0A166EPS1_9AGAM|nr:kinase-like protein [Sistotremastrum suecicum HHB10207 ss-3]
MANTSQRNGFNEFKDLTDRVAFAAGSAEISATGGSSDVYRATFSGNNVAVKVFRDMHVKTEDQRRSLASRIKDEMKVWGRMKHDNVLPFLGFCFYTTAHDSENAHRSIFSLVSPWMENGTIIEYCRSVQATNILEIRLKLLMDIVDGLSYLHSNGVVHGDIKGSNILVSHEGNALLADFGLARLVDDDTLFSNEVGTSTNNSLRGTIRWMAPELACGLDCAPRPTRQSDIWSYGCVVLELIASTVPYAKRRRLPSIIFAMFQKEPPAKYEGDMHPTDKDEHDIIPGIPVAFQRYQFLWTLCQACWNFEPDFRPRCQDIRLELSRAFEVRQPTSTLLTPQVEVTNVTSYDNSRYPGRFKPNITSQQSKACPPALIPQRTLSRNQSHRPRRSKVSPRRELLGRISPARPLKPLRGATDVLPASVTLSPRRDPNTFIIRFSTHTHSLDKVTGPHFSRAFILIVRNHVPMLVATVEYDGRLCFLHVYLRHDVGAPRNRCI